MLMERTELHAIILLFISQASKCLRAALSAHTISIYGSLSSTHEHLNFHPPLQNRQEIHHQIYPISLYRSQH